MVLSRSCIGVGFANSISFTAIERKISKLKRSGQINGYQAIPVDHPLSIYYAEENQITILDGSYNFVNFDTVDELIEYMQRSPRWREFRDAEFAFKANVLKFYQNHHLAVKLCETGTRYLYMDQFGFSNLCGKILMFIRSHLDCHEDDDEWEYEDRYARGQINGMDFLNFADSVSDREVNRLYRQIYDEGQIQSPRYETPLGIAQKHPLSHHYDDGSFDIQVTIMTDDFDLLTTTSALRLYGTLKLLFNRHLKRYAFQYLDPECPVDHKDAGTVDDVWLRRSTEFAFKVNLLRYMQNPNLVSILRNTGSTYLFCYTDPKWNIITARIHMILRHIFNGLSLDL